MEKDKKGGKIHGKIRGKIKGKMDVQQKLHLHYTAKSVHRKSVFDI